MTDRNTYLHYSSFHPKHLKDNLPYGQLLRLKRNSTDTNDFNKEADNLYKQLQARGYPKQVLNRTLTRSSCISRTSLLQPKRRHEENRITWALEFSPHSNQLRRIIFKHWHLLQEIEGCSSPPRIGFRRTKNLRNILVRANIRQDSLTTGFRQPKGHFRCGHCKICPTVMNDNKIIMRDRQFQVKYNTFSTCATEGVVYLIKCPCTPPLLYVGKTTRSLRTRLLEHQSRLRLKILEAPLVEHFVRMGHGESDFVHTVLYVGREHGEALENELLRTETYWINYLKCISPQGMNMNVDFSCFL